MRDGIARVWAFLKSAPLVLLALAFAVMAIQSARRARARAVQELRVGDPRLSLPGLTPREQARQIDLQLDATRRAVAHADAAKRARRLADTAASRIESAGHPSVAELVRSWNRE